jgi:hypothetical protein
MTGYLLPLTLDPWQIMTLDVVLDGEEFHAQVEIRYLPAPDQWVLSIWDHSSSELLVNMIPLICSYGQVNDLLLPFRHLRGGKGIGSMFLLRGGDTGARDPERDNLTEYTLLYGSLLG